MIDLDAQFLENFDATMTRLAYGLRLFDPTISDETVRVVQFEVAQVMWGAYQRTRDVARPSPTLRRVH